MANTFKQIQAQSFTLAGAGSSIADQSIVLSSMLTIDGTPITMTMIGDKGFFTIEPGNGMQEEAGTFTGITQNVNGTATLTGVKHQMFEDPYTETAGLTKSHAGGTSLILSNTAGFYQNFLRLGEENTVTDVITFAESPIVPTPTTAGQATPKSYVDGVVIAGGVNASSTVKGISKLTSDPSVPTDPIALNGEEVSAAGGNPDGVNKVVRANADGVIDKDFIELETTNPALAFSGNKLDVKIKPGGGLTSDANGLGLENTGISMPAYENLIAGDLLKTINDGGNYKLKKIVGINNLTHSAISYSKAVKINDTTILFVNNLQGFVGIISGSTITFGSAVTLNSQSYTGNWDVSRSSDTKYVITYIGSDSKTVYAQEGSISGNVITPNAATITLVGSSGTNDIRAIQLKHVDTDKVACVFVRGVSGTVEVHLRILDTSSSLAVGADAYKYANYYGGVLSLTKISTNKLCFGFYEGNNYSYLLYGVTLVGTTPTITDTTAFITGSVSDHVDSFNSCYDSDNSAVAVYKKNVTTAPVLINLSLNGSGVVVVSKSTTITGVAAAPLIKAGNFIYNLGSTINKILMNSTSFYLLSTANVSTSNSIYLLEEISGNVICMNNNTNVYKLLIDYDEFVTSANKSYNIGDNVPLIDIFTGFSGLINGADYYIKADASGITSLSTYQKVGKAVSDTTIIK